MRREKRPFISIFTEVEAYINLEHSSFFSVYARVDMNWNCPVCQKDFSWKDNMQRHMSSKHSESDFTPFQAKDVSLMSNLRKKKMNKMNKKMRMKNSTRKTMKS